MRERRARRVGNGLVTLVGQRSAALVYSACLAEPMCLLLFPSSAWMEYPYSHAHRRCRLVSRMTGLGTLELIERGVSAK